MKNIWSILCSRAIVDSNTNSLSLFDCIDEAVVGFSSVDEMNKPAKDIPALFTIASLWVDNNSSKERTFNQLVEIYDPNKRKLKDFSNNQIFERDKKRLRTLIQVNGLGITSEGQYTIVIKYKSEESDGKYLIASEIPLDIKFTLNLPVKK
jgi:hypothetical protein